MQPWPQSEEARALDLSSPPTDMLSVTTPDLSRPQHAHLLNEEAALDNFWGLFKGNIPQL